MKSGCLVLRHGNAPARAALEEAVSRNMCFGYPLVLDGAPAADGGDQTRNVAMGDDSQSFATTFVTKAAASANVGPTQVWGGR